MHALTRYSWILHLTCIAIGTYFLAQTFTTYVSSILQTLPESAERAEGSKKTPAPEEEEVTDRESYDVIALRNVFNSAASGLAGAAAGPDGVSEEFIGELGPAVKTSLGIKVLGTLMVGDGTDRHSSATVSGGSTGAADVYFVGDEKSFGSEVRLTKVEKDRIEFINRGRLEFAELEDFAAAGKSVFAAARDVHGDGGNLLKPEEKAEEEGAPAAGAGKIVIDQREIDEALANLDKLYTEIRIVPNFEGGQPNGFKVLSIKPGSIVGKLGIKRGDVLERINGQVLTVQKGMELFGMLKDEKNFSIDLVRRGQNTTLEYEIR